MASPLSRLAREPRSGPFLSRRLEAAYARGGIAFLKRALFGQLGLGFVVALVGALLTLLYTDLSAADLLIIVALSLLIYLADGALAIRPIREGLVPLERWSRQRDGAGARAAWQAAADLPFAPLRRRAPYLSVAVLATLWDVVGVTRLGFQRRPFCTSCPGRSWSGCTGSPCASLSWSSSYDRCSPTLGRRCPTVAASRARGLRSLCGF